MSGLWTVVVIGSSFGGVTTDPPGSTYRFRQGGTLAAALVRVGERWHNAHDPDRMGGRVNVPTDLVASRVRAPASPSG
jgi:hypothetical protein